MVLSRRVVTRIVDTTRWKNENTMCTRLNTCKWTLWLAHASCEIKRCNLRLKKSRRNGGSLSLSIFRAKKCRSKHCRSKICQSNHINENYVDRMSADQIYVDLIAFLYFDWIVSSELASNITMLTWKCFFFQGF